MTCKKAINEKASRLANTVTLSRQIARVPSSKCQTSQREQMFFCIFVGPQVRFLHYYTMILQRLGIIVRDAGFKSRTSAPEVRRATNEPPHLQTNVYSVCTVYIESPVSKISAAHFNSEGGSINTADLLLLTG